ncbi:MAG: [FeFe] hydrogenase H-cluster radical SAM maturase HydE [Candidatus Kapaibacterium sp.]
MKTIKDILTQNEFGYDDIVTMLSAERPDDIELLRGAADSSLRRNIGNKLYLRGLVEFSNICTCNCLYCGIRRDNHGVKRYTLDEEEILEAARWTAGHGYGSFVLQSGQRNVAQFIIFLEKLIYRIKEETASDELPEGLGITLSVGELSDAHYRRLYEAGAHRYLLRIETSNPAIFEKIHPPEQTFEQRIRALNSLKNIGYQTGTGVMIGIPGQTIEDLARDIVFFRAMDIDMIGMGPYLVHRQTPLGGYFERWAALTDEIYQLSLKMIAVARIVLGDVNIASTTALETIRPEGKFEGIRFGANVLMPVLTPHEHRSNYLLYDGKAMTDVLEGKKGEEFIKKLKSIDREIALGEWGDPKHYFNRTYAIKS